MDCLTGLKLIPDNSIDLVVTDPPYKTISGGKGGTGNRPSGMLTKNDGKIFTHNSIEIKDWIGDVFRVMKEGTHCYIFTNTLNLENMLTETRKAGFKLHNLLVWQKNNCTPNRWYMKNAEYVLFLRKGRAKAINTISSKTVHSFTNTKNRIHPTEKPCELLKSYILNSSNEGDLVLDPFMGSGALALSSLLTNREFIGFELDKEYFDLSIARLKSYE
jgi:site-specific DNA-methyltransferase (adenine-specific)